MSVVKEPTRRSTGSIDIADTQARLKKLERQEWWRWGTTFVAMLALTGGLIALTLPISAEDAFGSTGLTTAVRGLLGVVVLFHLFIIRQQLTISRMRKELSSQLCVIASLEAIRDSETDTDTRHSERRRWPRADFDQQLKITLREHGKTKTAYGRVRDISERGLGAIVPDNLASGEVVALEFSSGHNNKMAVQAIVRHRTGFRYGLEFLALTPQHEAEIGKILAAADPAD